MFLLQFLRWSQSLSLRLSRQRRPSRRSEMPRAKRPLRGQAPIALRVGKVLGRRKVGKHFTLEITDRSFRAARDETAIAREAALDGIYVLRTSVEADRLPTAEAVRSYKRLAAIERAFRSLKTVDLKVRPIHHRKADRVRAHVFLCILAYYVAAGRGGGRGRGRPRGAAPRDTPR